MDTTTTVQQTPSAKVRISISTKILFSSVSVLILSIAALGLSTSRITIDDKRAYIFEMELLRVETAKRALQQSISEYTNLLRTISAFGNQNNSQVLNTLLQNQSAIIAAAAYPSNADEVSESKIILNQKLAKDLGLEKKSLKLSGTFLSSVLPRISFQSPVLFPLKETDSSILTLSNLDNELVTSIFFPVTVFEKTVGDRIVMARSDGTALTGVKKFGESFSNHPLFTHAKDSKLSTGVLEYEHQGDRFLGAFAKPGLDLVLISFIPKTQAMRSALLLSEKFLVFGLVTVGIAIILALLFSKTITIPLRRLFQATKRVAEGFFEVDLKPRGSDEVSALSSSFVEMSKQIQNLISERVAKTELENEIKIASTVQQRLIPSTVFDDEKIEIRSFYRPASQCGGDWWGMYRVRNKLLIAIADATGHGLPSALLTSAMRACTSVLQRVEENGEFTVTPLQFLEYANRSIFDSAKGELQMTAWVGLIDFETNQLTYSNAGHNYPWLVNDGKIKSLTVTGSRLGEDPLMVKDLAQDTVTLKSGDYLFLYTDGLFDTGGDGNPSVIKKQAREAISSGTKSGQTPEEILKAVTNAYFSNRVDKPLADDITIVFSRIR